MEAFFPEVHHYLDYSYLEFLPQEVFTDVTAGEKYFVDILAKTRVRGEDGYVLVHIEPQSYKEEQFNKRMFKYFARLHEKYNLKVLPVAVLAHGVKKEEPASYEVNFPFFDVLKFNFLQLHLKRLSWREYLKYDNPAVAALLSHMDYTREERLRLKLEFFKMLLRFRLDPARMELLAGFFDSYVQLDPEEEQQFEEALSREIPAEEVSQVTEILTSWHKRGMEEGMEIGKVQTLQKIILKQANKKFKGISPYTEKKVQEVRDVALLESIVENLLDMENEEALVKALNK